MFKDSKDRDPALERQTARLRMEIMLKQSDIKKNDRALLEAEIYLRDIKHKQAQLQTDFLQKENKFEQLTKDHVQMQAELIKLTHQLNGLGH